MFRTVLSVSVACLVLLALRGEGLSQGAPPASSADRLEGVYEFVSEKVELTKPEKISGERTSSDWGGRWQFQNGYFTSVLMKRLREKFFESNKPEDVGFEAFAGSYSAGERSIRLTQTYSFHPFHVGRPVVMEYKLEGDTLTLTETLTPDDHHGSFGGKVTRVLKRVAAASGPSPGGDASAGPDGRPDIGMRPTRIRRASHHQRRRRVMPGVTPRPALPKGDHVRANGHPDSRDTGGALRRLPLSQQP